MGIITLTDERLSSIPPSRIFKATILDSHNLIPKLMPQAVKSIEIIQGNGGAGSIKQINFAEGSNFNYMKHHIDELNEETYTYKYTLIEGEALKDKLEKVCFEVKLEASTDGGTISKMTSKYYTKGDFVLTEEEIKSGKEKVLGISGNVWLVVLIVAQRNRNLSAGRNLYIHLSIVTPQLKLSHKSNQTDAIHAKTEHLAQFYSVGLLSCPQHSLIISLSSSRPVSQPRFIQHKKEAFWFYRFLSIVYDHVINPGHWTEDMRDEALEPADLYDRNMKVVDVGGGTGFTTLGIVKHVDAKNVTILDQSPHQLAKAKQKEPLKECKIIEGDAEDLPFPTDYADRYISAGSIEYWPDPQRGIKEAYRVLKIGGKACIIGPVYPTFWLSRFFADVWMLFPKEEEYIEWFEKAGFKDIQLKRIGPKWYRGVRRHGLIMGCSVTGVKPFSGDSPLQLGPKAEDVEKPVNPIVFFLRFILGATAATYFVLVPIYMWLKDQIVPKGRPI
ncbi:hypothetical protein F0562_035469 [Nyssa sinensis]|uniref:MPBQ/MBSQ family SAM-binding methyltransferase profile domain-containing protein n=1 Tax=Nyssa sinensis TaxID=561372 RepID=A0A5J5ACT0_9ASTE|nr:hypothetical protein F0562_035469 [Nyssa sinensis]